MYCWIMLIWVLVIWQAVQPKQTKLRKAADGVADVEATTKYCILLFIVPWIIVSLRTDFGDTSAYISKYLHMPTGLGSFSSFIKTETKAPLFVALEYFFKTIAGDNAQIFLGAIALLHSWLLMRTLKQYSPDVGMSVFMFIATSLILNWMGNGIRQCTAVLVIFASTELLLKKKYVPYYTILFLMMGLTPICNRFGWGMPIWFLGGIHQSTIIMILASFCITGKAFNNRVWIVAAALVVLILSGGLGDVLEDAVEDTTYINDLSYAQKDTGTSILRVLVAMVPMLMALLAAKEIKKNTTPPIISLCANASVITSVLYVASAFTSGIYVGRLPVYTEMYNLILVPWLIRHPYKENKQIITIAFIGCYMAYFFYQVSIQWKGLFKVGIL